MNRDEVQGLQALAMAQGGSLSINPYTGLPEAFDLKGAFKKYLPTIVGAAGSMMGLGPVGAALAGGLTGAATSKGNLLEGFAMGALGGYGGAGLATGLGAGAAGGTNPAAVEAAKNTAQSTPAVSEAAKIGANKAMLGSPSQSLITSPSPGVSAGLSPRDASMLTNGPTGPLAGSGFDKAANDLVSKLPQGAQNFINKPPGLIGSGIASLTSAASRAEVPKMKQGPLFRQYDFDPITREFTAKEPSDTWQDPYAAGAAAGGAINNIAAQNNYLANMSRGGATDTDINSYSGEPRYAQGGMPPDMGGRFLKGPGDGVSDSIPAEIAAEGGTIPAKLAAGEFVVPARIVAEIGNGSSDAGAKELYRMLDRIEARMKKSKRGKDSGARKELVA
jgi:hypothetical protein